MPTSLWTAETTQLVTRSRRRSLVTPCSRVRDCDQCYLDALHIGLPICARVMDSDEV